MSKTFAILLCCVMVTIEGKYLTSMNNVYKDKQMEFGVREKTECPAIVTKVLSDLLVSEYNRLLPTNPIFYTKSRVIDAVCQKNDLSECSVTLELSCRRSNGRTCSAGDYSPMTQICNGVIDLTSGSITSQLECRSADDNYLSSDVEDAVRALAPPRGGSYGLGEVRIMDHAGREYMKKKWEDDEGNFHPF
nr:uncharacterized protein LOC100180087 [Ciona intestinalis]|eukprot:XP_002128289.2 uncharacterized protein LOC100180087 [Ciona intestinalis]